jgi:hypothetical protein
LSPEYELLPVNKLFKWQFVDSGQSMGFACGRNPETKTAWYSKQQKIVWEVAAWKSAELEVGASQTPLGSGKGCTVKY